MPIPFILLKHEKVISMKWMDGYYASGSDFVHNYVLEMKILTSSSSCVFLLGMYYVTTVIVYGFNYYLCKYIGADVGNF